MQVYPLRAPSTDTYNKKLFLHTANMMSMIDRIIIKWESCDYLLEDIDDLHKKKGVFCSQYHAEFLDALLITIRHYLGPKLWTPDLEL